jgi:hypothetical protein
MGSTRKKEHSMVTHRTNAHSLGRAASAEECFAAMQRHNVRGTPTARPAPIAPSAEPVASTAGDIIYGAKAIARFIFAEEVGEAYNGTKNRRRVFNLWSHYSQRQERAGFFKLKGALCLSKSQWRAFHGLG